MGFVDPQPIPFTNSEVYIHGMVSYAKATDTDWLRDHFSYNYFLHNGDFLTTDYYLHYKNMYLSTSPRHRFVFTIGAQAASQFGGNRLEKRTGYSPTGEEYDYDSVVHMNADAKAFFRTIIAGSGGAANGDHFVEGNHLGSWDIKGEYKLGNGHKIAAYYQSPWEDGSGIGKLNGFDGLWGLQYNFAPGSPVETVLVEYLDFTNQSGPIHWAPKDHEYNDIPNQATGSDDYYNNYTYNGYQILGHSIGSPIVPAPLYNNDGLELRFRQNDLRAWHLAVRGTIGKQFTYKAMCSHTASRGTKYRPIWPEQKSFSAMVEAGYTPLWLEGLQIRGQVAWDRGQLRGHNFGALLCITYSGIFGKL